MTFVVECSFVNRPTSRHVDEVCFGLHQVQPENDSAQIPRCRVKCVQSKVQSRYCDRLRLLRRRAEFIAWLFHDKGVYLEFGAKRDGLPLFNSHLSGVGLVVETEPLTGFWDLP